MIGQTISHYRITEKLGGGGMGVVYKAEDLELKRSVALKFLPMTLGADPESKERFTHEAQAASALDHTNICTIHEIGRMGDGQLFICMAYYEGESLKQKIEQGPLKIEEAVDIAVQVARGLAKAHEHGILHRDIKPANIMITTDGVAKIVDFGLAKLGGVTRLTRTGSTLGTAMYMSPEQARGEEADQRTDLWSLGVVLYEMLTGRTPFRGEHQAAIMYSVLNEEPQGLREGIPGISPGLETILRRALEKDRNSRYRSSNEMVSDLESLRLAQPPISGLTPRAILRAIRRPRVLVPLLVVLLGIIIGAVWMVSRQGKIRWARETLLPEIEQRISAAGMENGVFFPGAYELAVEAKKYIPDDPKLLALLPRCMSRVSVITDPPGANIYMNRINGPDNAWEYIGVTPAESVQVPMGVFAWKLTKDGYDTVIAVHATYFMYSSETPSARIRTITRTLDKRGTIPAGMVHIPGMTLQKGGVVEDYYIDRFEVTNRQYRSFVEHGGYQKSDYWKQPFVRNGEVISWKEAMAELVDQTGRPGPSTWIAGSYPEGQEEYPVSGISWYEAAAYADFVGKSLPTAQHWGLATLRASPGWPRGVWPIIMQQSNFAGKGPVAVGTFKGMSSFGLFDIAGNVREWCWNEMPGGRLIRGAAWNDASYMAANYNQASAFDRSPKNGFRCVLFTHPEKVPHSLFDKCSPDTQPDFYKQKPVADRVFEVYKEQFAYDRTDLNAAVEWRNEEAKDWVQEKVSFDAAYGGERVTAYLFLPKNSKPPFQTVIYFPGSASVEETSSKDLDKYIEFKSNLYFFLQGGRAVLYPVYKGTFERGDTLITPIHAGANSRRFTEYLVQLVKEFRRSIDYLETRPDIDTGKIAYCGFSWGGLWGAVIPAVETRLKCSVIILGGLWEFGRPEAKQINYVTRVRIPTLMMSGRYDIVFPLETSARPYYDLLGTPKQHKVQKIFESDHFIPTNDLVRESLTWLDKYLGPPLR